MEVPAAAPGWQGSWAGRRSSRLGMGCRAVRGVLLRGRGGLLWPRLMTGMCGGRGEGEEHGGREAEDEEEAGGASGQGEVLAGAGSSGGGGEDRAGQDPPADPAGALGLPSPAPSPAAAASVSAATGSGVAVGVRLSCDGSSCSAPSSRRSSPSEDVSARGGLPASAVPQDGGEAEEEGEERGRSWGEAGVRAEASSFSIMAALRPPPAMSRCAIPLRYRLLRVRDSNHDSFRSELWS